MLSRARAPSKRNVLNASLSDSELNGNETAQNARMPRAARSAPNPAHVRIWAVVARIPRGCVATYGQVAREAGLPGRARLAGRALAEMPAKPALPWYRVLNAQGRISLPAGSRGAPEQARRLKAEGVEVKGSRVSLARHRWRPRSDAPVLD
jgi:methylated-DNA-protein-cysteine methyltransferase-like protein